MKLKENFKRFKVYIKNFCTITNIKSEKGQKTKILHNLTCLLLGCFILIILIKIKTLAFKPDGQLAPLLIISAIVLFFFILLFLEKTHRCKNVAKILIILITIPTIHALFYWGADFPVALILSILIITLSGALLNTRAVIISAASFTAFIIALTYFQQKNLIVIKDKWRQTGPQLDDSMICALLILIISLIIIIFTTNLRQALKTAENSRKMLQKETNLLEIKIQERAKEIEEMQSEKISQLYRLAEFGRISAGIFHDLINPLTAISLNLEQINGQEQEKLESTRTCLSQAIIASNKMADLISSIKKSIAAENEKKQFLLISEIKNIASLLKYQAQKANVTISVFGDRNACLYGDVLKFHQIMTNLIVNGIEACVASSNRESRKVIIKIKRIKNILLIKVIDNGVGIKVKNVNQIFEPFFSTKNKRGLGLGLSSTKNLIEKDFKGNIKAYTSPQRLTTFIIKIPLAVS
ncbi:MAG: HAMP domain-containing sensor histidine kinase [Patescibacteria group bacterium]|nr:HAMP domain-containing sensor histidine kinase [Patescibacteria group bacterium]MDD3939561.1 HAMP domain-containing sensor histidine kinase [Patescibacteria group bacterium]